MAFRNLVLGARRAQGTGLMALALAAVRARKSFSHPFTAKAHPTIWFLFLHSVFVSPFSIVENLVASVYFPNPHQTQNSFVAVMAVPQMLINTVQDFLAILFILPYIPLNIYRILDFKVIWINFFFTLCGYVINWYIVAWIHFCFYSILGVPPLLLFLNM